MSPKDADALKTQSALSTEPSVLLSVCPPRGKLPRMSSTRRQIRTRLPFTLLISAPGLRLLSNLYFSFSQVLASLEPKITHCTCCYFLGHHSSQCHPLSPANSCCKRLNMEFPPPTPPQSPKSPGMCRSTGRLLCPSLRAAPVLPKDTSSCRDTAARLLGCLGRQEMLQHGQASACCQQQHHRAPVQPQGLLQGLRGRGGAEPGTRTSRTGLRG